MLCKAAVERAHDWSNEQKHTLHCLGDFQLILGYENAV